MIREKYSGTEQERFGPTLAAEHLADEDGLEVGEETLRRWTFGDLVQLDGSFHAWFEERGQARRGCEKFFD